MSCLENGSDESIGSLSSLIPLALIISNKSSSNCKLTTPDCIKKERALLIQAINNVVRHEIADFQCFCWYSFGDVTRSNHNYARLLTRTDIAVQRQTTLSASIPSIYTVGKKNTITVYLYTCNKSHIKYIS